MNEILVNAWRLCLGNPDRYPKEKVLEQGNKTAQSRPIKSEACLSEPAAQCELDTTELQKEDIRQEELYDKGC